MEQYLAHIEEALRKINLPDAPEKLYQPIRYTLDLGGKRVRPFLVLLAYQIFQKDVEKALPLALAIELFHNFTLLHDDVMDNAPLRRGKPTVHAHWNRDVAILSGDALMILAYQELAKIQHPDLAAMLGFFNEIALAVCEGQQMDMDFETQQAVSIAEYMEMIRKKTAVLVGASLKMGAWLAGANTQEQNTLYKLGEDMGLAFQLQDDYLDVFGKAGFGKEIGGDILAHKKTFLLLSLQAKIGQNALNTLLEQPYASPQEKIATLRKAYEAQETDKANLAQVAQYSQEALQALQHLPKNQASQWLENFIQQLLEREK
jgi:geranylgeranyl diphosphate synthase type II